MPPPCQTYAPAYKRGQPEPAASAHWVLSREAA